jgi:hypothetical protein
MSTQGARVIDLDEYRRRRAARSERPAATTAEAPVLWVPVWMWVPFQTASALVPAAAPCWPFR